MSHSDTVLVLADGLNVLTGPNNCGKSAVISALQMLAELPAKEGDYMVRHGEKSGCRIIVETAEGDEICWGRSGAAPYLVINGEKHFRISNFDSKKRKELTRRRGDATPGRDIETN